ncbi:TonB-dependent receptor [Phenylobacterium sp. LH3H17]|uniref:TonB-dependent receptor plug domain-containing protein n=1 Tax=Phenylobacterium sp. LH3H17 TaxID=2903901 RepID=UPI0020C95727|nr:TonB-dependent receptor [Phenylobacterium sp. LH3H17]UTP40873.1 TonB-dependent receptor [Phenylobacterium sp. LH3H17]
MKSVFAGVSALALACGMAGAAVAQTTDEAADELDVLIVTGTRMTGLRAVDSPAPIQVLDETALARVAQNDLIQAIAQNVPSFNAQAFGGDTANLTLSAKLRGLSPNHALVLINGKRRHGTSNLAVLGGPFQGGATADLNFIPLGSVSHIEVLQDGAAAQYGTDAIAGVINIILKDQTEGGSVVISGGKYFDGGGLTGDITANIGLSPIEGAYLNMTLESRWHDHTFRGDVDPRTIDTPYNTASSSRLSRYPQIAGHPDYPYMNRITGDAEYRLNVFSYNSGYEIGPDTEVYSFGTYGTKYGAAYENYRVPGLIVGKDGTVARPFGFSPKEAIRETDYAASLGIKGKVADWNWDLSTTYGRDEAAIDVLNSLNRSLYIDTSTLTTKGFSPTDFHAGDFMASQWTTTLDVARGYEVGMATPLNVALGGEYRKDKYQIKPGDEASRYKEGSQSYPGFALTDAGSYERENWAVYANLAVSPIEALKLDGAVRYEHFSDFGDTTVVKATARYDFNEMFALRGTASTGFRAPTLAESFYSATNVSPTAAFVQLPPNSPAAKLVGIDGLDPEKSTNFSIGFVAHPGAGVTATFDAYQIEVEDRIVGSGSLFGSGGAKNIPAVLAAILANGNVLDPTVTQTGITIFTNGLDTRTRGAELVVTYTSDLADYGAINWSLTANYNETKVTKIAAPPAQLAGASLFDAAALSDLEDSSPKYRFVLGGLWTWDKLTVNLREALYGPSSNLRSRTGAVYYKTEIDATFITDLEVSYKFTDSVKLAVGANNLFNTYPDMVNAQLRDDYFRNNSNAYVTKYPTFSPFGINGGYYYSKLSFTF